VCGICGLVVSPGAAPPDPLLVRRMIGRLSHRGPDGSGMYIDDRAALGHARLAIIDVQGGSQPLSNEDGSLWISFNGEIFNYVELAAQLASRGHCMRTRSDTEVIVHAFEEWGMECFARFNGQWAVALWDARAGRLVLSRDRMGVRPLYHCLSGGTLRFASEVTGLFADRAVSRRLDPAGLREAFTFWCPVAPRTVFDGVSELPPGHSAVFQDGVLRVQPYWSIGFPARGAEACQSLVENAAGLRERLIEAARLRFLRSDVTVGAYLSGGIDSSVTAAVIARYTDAPLRTFSLRFTDPEYDEGRYQDLMSRRLGTEHRSIDVSAADIGRVFPDVVRHAEKPLLRAAPAPLFLLSRLVRDSGCKVVVTGEGSDEALGGYDIYREAMVRLFWTRDPGSAMRERIVGLLYPWMERSPAAAPSFARAFFSRNLDPRDPAISHRPRWDAAEGVRALLRPGMRAAMDAEDPAETLTARMPSGHEEWDPLARAQWLEMTTLLPGYILSSQGDRMLMANSVEGRFPFLDAEVVAFSNGLPGRHKLMGLDEKHILKEAFADLVPEEILRRPKQPYRAPDAASFFAGAPWVREAVEPAAVEEAGVFEPAAVARLMEKCGRVSGEKMGNTDNMRVCAVLSTQLLHAQLVAGDDAGPEAPPEPFTLIDARTRTKEASP
jgi:asparagine synthase (glutamine-hydrolysing)